ncbi:MAG: capsular polysaccharide synthesis protein [Clostridia bacterium]|nr:capsular polysaccharide synthesis protein [Clostridia bacterium]
MGRLFQRTKHFLQRVGNGLKRFPRTWKTFGGKVARVTFFDGLRPVGKTPKYINTIQAYVDNFLADVVEKHKTLPDESEKPQGKIPVWCCWWQGTEQMPEIVKMCHERLKQILPEEQAELHVITLDNYQNYVDVPEHIIDKFNRKIITMTTMSDVLRFRLLEKYGGYWLDATLFFTSEIPSQYFSGDFYCQRMALDTPDVRREACKGNWCGFSMAGPAHSPVFKFMNDAFDKWWAHYDTIIEYVLIDYMLMTGFSHVPQIHDIIDAVPNNNTEIFAFYKKLNEPYSSELYAELTKINVMHKLTYKIDLKKETADGQETLYARMLDETYQNGEKDAVI